MTRLRLRPLTDEVYDRVAAAAAESIPITECPTCGAKQVEVAPSIYGWENGTYRFRGEEHECDCEMQMMLRKHYLAANIPDQYQRLNWDDYDCPEVREMVAIYLDGWDSSKRNGMGMTFQGSLGTGKTFAATHIGKELVKRGERVHFTPFLEVISAYSKQHAEDIEHLFKSVGVLILDELLPPEGGPQKALFARRYEELIRHRTNFNLPTIVTTNLSDEELNKHYPRTNSLLAPKQIPVTVPLSADARIGKITWENVELLKNKEVRPLT